MSDPTSIQIKPGHSVITQADAARNRHRIVARTGLDNPHDINDVTGDPIVYTDTAGNTKVTFYQDSGGGQDYVAQVFSNDPVTGMVDIQGPQFQVIEMDVHGTGIYDALILSADTARTANFTIPDAGFVTIYTFDCTAGDLVCTMPNIPNKVLGSIYLIGKSDDSAHTLTIQPQGSDLLNGGTTPIVLTGRGKALITLQIVASGPVRSWEGEALVGATHRFKLVWNFDGSVSGANDDMHWQLPCNCNIVGAMIANKQDSPVTMTPRIRRASDTAYPGTWDASPLDDGNLALNPGTFIKHTSPSDFTGWTTALSKEDVLRVEVATADASAIQMILTLQLEEVV